VKSACVGILSIIDLIGACRNAWAIISATDVI
jgi:hypothetical protein